MKIPTTTTVDQDIQLLVQAPSDLTARLLPPVLQAPTTNQPEEERPFGRVNVMTGDSDPFLQLKHVEDFFNYPLPIKSNDFTPADFERDPYERIIRNPAVRKMATKTPRIQQDPIQDASPAKTIPLGFIFGCCTPCNQLVHNRERISRPARRKLVKPGGGAADKNRKDRVEIKIMGRNIKEFVHQR